MERKTKIIATISDKRCEVGFLRSLYEAGMNVARINTAHVTTVSADRIVDNIRQVSDKIAIMVDTKGPEIRVTAMAPGHTDGVAVNAGDRIKVSGTSDNALSGPDMIYMNHPSLYSDVPLGASLLIDDGDIELMVVEKADGVLLCEVRNSGVIGPRKSVNVPGAAISLPSITPRDREFIEWAIERDLDFIAHSFVRSAQDVREVKKILKERERPSPIKIISKIENRQGVDNIDGILLETYGVMVARGDLGVEVRAEELPVMQRYIVKKCLENKAPVIIATQMLHSMMTNPRPTRAEVSDIAGAVYERVDAIMLSGETANGAYPVEAIRTMDRVALEIEKDNNHNAPFIDMNMVSIRNEVTAQLARSAVRACLNLPIKAVVCDTMSGRTGRYLSTFRGQRPVYAMCYRKSVMRQLALSFGVEPMYCEPTKDHASFLYRTLELLKGNADLSSEDMVAVVGGDFGDAAGASFLEIAYVRQLESKVGGYRGMAGNGGL